MVNKQFGLHSFSSQKPEIFNFFSPVSSFFPRKKTIKLLNAHIQRTNCTQLTHLPNILWYLYRIAIALRTMIFHLLDNWWKVVLLGFSPCEKWSGFSSKNVSIRFVVVVVFFLFFLCYCDVFRLRFAVVCFSRIVFNFICWIWE